MIAGGVSDAAADGHPRNSFDAVRMFAALCVLLGHQFDFAGYPHPRVGPLGIKLADTGLYIFFAISGYLVFRSLRRDGRTTRFVAARVLRIYPGAAVNTVACVVFGAAITTVGQAAYWSDPSTWSFLAHNIAIAVPPTGFRLPGVFEDTPTPIVTAPIWTLKYELLCYLVLFAGFKLLRGGVARVKVALLAAEILVVGAFVYGLLVPAPNKPGLDGLYGYEQVHVLRFFVVFFAGALRAACEPLSGQARLLFVALPAGLIVFGPGPEVARAGVLLTLGILMIEVGLTPVFFSAAYQRLGDLSYGTYLYAVPIQKLLIARAYDGRNFAAVTAASLCAILACAFLSWRLVERPALRWKRRFGPMLPQGDPPAVPEGAAVPGGRTLPKPCAGLPA